MTQGEPTAGTTTMSQGEYGQTTGTSTMGQGGYSQTAGTTGTTQSEYGSQVYSDVTKPTPSGTDSGVQGGIHGGDYDTNNGAGTRGGDTFGTDARGADTLGIDARGADTTGAGTLGTDTRGADATGPGTFGTDTRGADTTGPGYLGTDARGVDTAGTVCRGDVILGYYTRGADTTGAGTLGTDSRGIDTTGADTRGADTLSAGTQGGNHPNESQGAGGYGGTEDLHHGDDAQRSQANEAVDRVEKSSDSKKGEDPALVGDDNPNKKLTGTGQPGSHSAVFGLTPDGTVNTDTSSKTTKPVAAHSKDTAVGGGKESTEGDAGSRAREGNPEELKNQMQESTRDAGQSGGGREDPAPLKGEEGAAPGSGGIGLQQGGGNV